MTYRPFVAPLLLGLAPAVTAQGFSYPDFEDLTGITLAGAALGQASVVQLNPAQGSSVGALWRGAPVDVVDGFETQIAFRIRRQASGGADGMAFVLHNDPRGLAALGASGSALGYGALSDSDPGTAIANSLVVEIDTWGGSSWGDSSDNEISVHTNGTGENSQAELYSLARVTPSVDMSDGRVHVLGIQYQPGVLGITLDGAPILAASYELTLGGVRSDGNQVEGLRLIEERMAWVGITGASGAAWEAHDAVAWHWSPGAAGQRYCTSTDNSTGGSALVEGYGSVSIATNDFLLRAGPVPHQPGIFYYGRDRSTATFGDGIRCVGGSYLGRLPVVHANGGQLAHQVDLQAPPNMYVRITPGSTWNFQAWFRDPTGGPSGFNLSDAIEVTFVP